MVAEAEDVRRVNYFRAGLALDPVNEPLPTMAVGTVRLWGEVIEHERGYRAEFAKVHSLDHVFGEADLAALRARYGVG